MMTNKLIAIMGPTASGKSALALKLALQNNGEIINFDSMQIYADLPLITACPSMEDYQQVPHHLYELQPVTEPLNAAAWADLARHKILDCWKRSVQPILVGGTGFYLKVLKEGISPIPDVAQSIVDDLMLQMQRETIVALHKELQICDPELAAQLKEHDQQRIIRALSVFRATDKPLSAWQKIPLKPFLPADITWEIYGISPKRAALYERCNKRFDIILAQGALQEVQALYQQQLSNQLPAMRSVGVKQLLEYFDGTEDLTTATNKAKQATRNYAKRQLTWVRNSLHPTHLLEHFGDQK